MARDVVGVMVCPECGNPGAEVKRQKNGSLVYRWCPDCKAQYFPRSQSASDRLAEKVATKNAPVTDTGTGGVEERAPVIDKAPSGGRGFDMGL
jgi:ssDNA-binding Zn-finger/Zn-ribbon topoisomerase 1